ncbi:hypothetical protein MMC25_005266 [Agyrium rufum]|nr:hypothetical protein [Agyrium rufum]
MAPQTSIPLTANILGTIGTVFWCIQLVPQVWYNWRRKNTDGLPGLMMFLWAMCAIPFGVYAIVQNFNIPVQIQAQIFGTLAIVVWVQILIYHDKWRRWTASLLGAGLWALSGGVEALLILTLRGPYNRGVEWPIILVGVVAAVLLAFGLLPPYLEIRRRRGRVIGINFIFLSIDTLGAFFSLVSLLTQDTFDILGGIIYILTMVLELGIFASHIVWRIRTRKLHRRAKAEGIAFDDMPEAKRYQYHDDDDEEPDASPSTTIPVAVTADEGVLKMEEGTNVVTAATAETANTTHPGVPDETVAKLPSHGPREEGSVQSTNLEEKESKP